MYDHGICFEKVSFQLQLAPGGHNEVTRSAPSTSIKSNKHHKSLVEARGKTHKRKPRATETNKGKDKDKDKDKKEVKHR